MCIMREDGRGPHRGVGCRDGPLAYAGGIDIAGFAKVNLLLFALSLRVRS